MSAAVASEDGRVVVEGGDATVVSVVAAGLCAGGASDHKRAAD